MLNKSLKKYSLKESRFADMIENDNCYEKKQHTIKTQIGAIT